MYYDWIGNDKLQSTYNKLPLKPSQAWKLLLHRMIQLDVVDPWKLRAATDLTGISEQMVRGQTIVYESRVRDQRIEAIRLKEAPINNEVPGIINVDAGATVISDLATPSFTDTTKSNVSVKSATTSLKYKKLMDEG